MAFFFNDTATTEIYTLSLHDALPIYQWSDVVTYDNDEERGLDPVSLDGAVAAALTRPAPRPADRGWRAEQKAAVRAVHGQVYAQGVADRAGCGRSRSEERRVGKECRYRRSPYH